MRIIFEVPANYVPGTNDKLIINLKSSNFGFTRFDDFRFHCLDCTTTSRKFDIITGEVTYELDELGYATKYIYDDAGRITSVYKELEGSGLIKVSDSEYNYHRPLEP